MTEETDPPAIDAGTTLRRRGEWLTARVGDEMVMMDADSGSHIGLTETGARIWDLIEQPTTFAAICSALAEEYDAPAEAIAADIVGFLRQLAAREAISLEPPA